MSLAIDSKEKNGNLHLSLNGKFTAFTALKITEIIQEKYQGEGNIFVNTAKVTEIDQNSQNTLSQMIHHFSLPKNKIYLKGIKGHELSANDLQVIEYRPKKHGCGGNCKNCRSGNKELH